MRHLLDQHHLPFRERDSDLRIKAMEVVDVLQGDLVKYECSSPTGGVFVRMPRNSGLRIAIRVFLRQIGLVATGETMDDTYPGHEDYAFIERFILEAHDG